MKGEGLCGLDVVGGEKNRDEEPGGKRKMNGKEGGKILGCRRRLGQNKVSATCSPQATACSCRFGAK